MSSVILSHCISFTALTHLLWLNSHVEGSGVSCYESKSHRTNLLWEFDEAERTLEDLPGRTTMTNKCCWILGRTENNKKQQKDIKRRPLFENTDLRERDSRCSRKMRFNRRHNKKVHKKQHFYRIASAFRPSRISLFVSEYGRRVRRNRSAKKPGVSHLSRSAR